MSNFIPFGQGFMFSLSLCFDLGIVNVAIIKVGVEQGFRKSFMVGFGSCFGDLIYLTLALLGVSFLFEYPFIRWPLWTVGTIYLVWLAIQMARDAYRPKPGTAPADQQAPSQSRKSLKQHWLTGILLALSSPTTIMWFALIAGPIVGGMKFTFGYGLEWFIAGFFFAGLAWSATIARLSAWSGAAFGQTFVRIISASAAVLLLYFAWHIFTNGLQDLIG
ncbi:LysE family translocator [Paenibacillus sp. MMS18-CY102]|uniref:LysE family translocator n=1 Tax=Paenibacillus sp. MMS18-CY102 TaxID=2682849 RepID=UPI001365A13D|nr:LysE family transporter [Paenibacillus sp. MMS18-CY102]MWC27396.1 LysE family transporter [Paenibacillus sp. MMS18-CY102]